MQNELRTPPSPPSSPRRRATDGNTENLEVLQVPTRAPRDAAPGCAAAHSVPCRWGRLTWSASKAMELASRNMSPAPGHGRARVLLGGGEAIAPGPGPAHMVGSQGASGPEAHPAVPAPLLPRPSLSIQHLVFVRRCRCRSFQEHTFDRKINKNRHHQSRRPTTPPLRRRTAGGNGRALLPWRWQSGLSRVIAIQESSETTTCSAAAAQHAICGRPMWPSNLVCSAALRYKTGPRYLRCGKRQLVRGAPPSAYHVVRLQPHLCCRTPTWYLQRKSVYADGDSS